MRALANVSGPRPLLTNANISLVVLPRIIFATAVTGQIAMLFVSSAARLGSDTGFPASVGLLYTLTAVALRQAAMREVI